MAGNVPAAHFGRAPRTLLGGTVADDVETACASLQTQSWPLSSDRTCWYLFQTKLNMENLSPRAYFRFEQRSRQAV